MQFLQYFSQHWLRISQLGANPARSWRILQLAASSSLLILCGCAGAVSPGTKSSVIFSISGSIAPQSAGNKTTLALSGPARASTTGDSSGHYAFSGLADGAYVVTPGRSGYFFEPAVQSVTLNGTSAAGINFTASQQSTHSVGLSWHSSSSVVAGYNVYRSTTDGGPYHIVNSTLITSLGYTDYAVQGATTYFYVSTAVDLSDVESEYSNQATAIIQ